MISSKKRVLVALFVLASLILTGVIVVGLRILNIYNIHDPLFFDRDEMFVEYEYNDGEDDGILKFEVTKVKDDTAEFEYSFKNDDAKFKVTHDGFYINESNDKETDYQTIFWVHIVEEESVGSEIKDYIGEKYELYDPIGILGNGTGVYTLKCTGYKNYWPLEPGIQGAQASITFEVFNEDDELVAEGSIDRTCGLVFEMYIGAAGNYRTMIIKDTNYDIGRNRVTGWIAMLILAITLPILAYILMLKFKPMKIEDDDERLEMAVLIACGTAVITIDIYIDIWWYAVLGATGCFILHAAATGVLALICIWQKYGIRCVIPSACEFLFLLGFLTVDPALLGPYISANLGLLMTFMIMLYSAGYMKPDHRVIFEP